MFTKISTKGSDRYAGQTKKGIDYKWVVLSNTTISTMMGSINGSIILISLPDIFNGLQINPLTSLQYLLWLLMGYGLVTATLVPSFGRLSDMYGRVRVYKLGFLVFTIGSILLFFTPGTGDAGAVEIIVFRLLQGVGSAMFMANTRAILTDAFPFEQRGVALGMNAVALLSGQFFGLILGGVLAIIDWRLVFLVSVPFGIFGTVWSYLKLREVSPNPAPQKIDWIGNLAFVAGMTILLIGITYGLMPYGSDPMGWSNPWVVVAMVAGIIMLVAFPIIEARVASPMFKLDLFRLRAFSYGSLAAFLSSLSRGGVMFMLVLMLQGIWLPLHGYSYADTPFWAGIYMLPIIVGVLIMSPISGILSDRYGPRIIATCGMLLVSAGFILLARMPFDFNYVEFGLTLFLMGLGYGMFGSPNSSSIMSAVPPEHRGIASGMMSMLMNTAQTISMAIFFTIVIVGISGSFPAALGNSLAGIGASGLTPVFSSISPSGALFAAFLGYNPVAMIIAALPASVMSAIPASTLAALSSSFWFPSTLGVAFLPSLRTTFYIGAVLCFMAAILSALRGERYVHELHANKHETLAADGGAQKKD
jgi:EmrB/QacA subfamily drug resistance transporter